MAAWRKVGESNNDGAGMKKGPASLTAVLAGPEMSVAVLRSYKGSTCSLAAAAQLKPSRDRLSAAGERLCCELIKLEHFKKVKTLDLMEVVQHYTGEPLRQIGAETYALDSDTCPHADCGHSGCFRIKFDPDDPDGQFGKCFSCDWWFSDAAGFVAGMKGISNYEAAQLVLSDASRHGFPLVERTKKASLPKPIFRGVVQPSDRLQRLFDRAAEHYQLALKSSPKAQAYQSEIRQHDIETLLTHGVGYSDGRLVTTLVAEGEFTRQEINEAGLANEQGFDFLPKETFIYAHRDAQGRTSHFTFKDPSKQLCYQMRARHALNEVLFFGEHTLSDNATELLIVEGENDLLSCIEAGWSGAIVATNGSISGAQLAAISKQYAGRSIITLFDRDHAGDKYRTKVEGLGLPRLTQYLLPEEGQDPDSALKSLGVTITELLARCDRLTPAPEKVTLVDTTDYPMTDVDNAILLKRVMAGRMLFVREHGNWAYFDGGRWILRSEHIAYAFAEVVGRSRVETASRLPAADEGQQKARNRAIREASQCLNKSRLEAMISLASKDKELLRSAEDFDRDAFLMGVVNGVVDLRTGRLQAPDKSMMLTKQCLASHDLNAQCPQWIAMLKTALQAEGGDTEAMIEYLQQVFGLALIGKVLERAFFFIYGKPGTGKSLTTNTVRRVLGDYAMELSPNSLMATNNPSNDVKNSEIAQLKGVRFALASETEQGQRFNDSLIKRITGQDAIVVRELYEKSFSLVPQATLFITGNSRPTAGGGSAMWERLKVISFNHQIPKHEQDAHLQEKLLAEADGILAWMIQGCIAYQQRGGLNEPERVRQDTGVYLEETDLTLMFIKECCEVGDDLKDSSPDIFEAYKAWAEYVGVRPLGRTGFYEKMRDAGHPVKKARTHAHGNPQSLMYGLRLTKVMEVSVGWHG